MLDGVMFPMLSGTHRVKNKCRTETGIDDDNLIVTLAAQDKHGVAEGFIHSDILKGVDGTGWRPIHLANLHYFDTVGVVCQSYDIRSFLAISYARSTSSGSWLPA